MPLIQQAIDLCFVEKVAVFATLIQLLSGPLPQFSKEPFVNGDTEALFLAIDQLIGNDPPHGFLEEVFQCPVLSLCLFWNAQGHFDNR